MSKIDSRLGIKLFGLSPLRNHPILVRKRTAHTIPLDTACQSTFVYNGNRPSYLPWLTPKATGLPPEWEVRVSKTKQMPYYFNRETNESSWQPPPNSDLGVLQEYLATNLSSANGHPEKIRVRHLLVKHSKSRRPSSWKEVPPRFLCEVDVYRKQLRGHLTKRERFWRLIKHVSNLVRYRSVN